MKKNLLLIIMALCFAGKAMSQTVNIAVNPSSSGNAVVGGSNYHITEAIYLNSEIGAGNFVTAGTAITNLGFNCTTVGTGSSTVASPTFTIYLQNVPSATTTFVAGTYNTAGYTQVYSGSFSYPTTGFKYVTLQTSFTRTAGTNLQVLIVRTDNVLHTGNVFATSNGNSTSTTLNTTRRYNSTAAPVVGTTALAVSAFRPQISIQHVFANDASVDVVYTLGKLPIPNGSPWADSAVVTNRGSNAMTNISVTETITGVNPFTNTKTIASLAVGATAVVAFDSRTPTVEGNDNISVTISNDDFTGNNTKTLTQIVNKNTWSYAQGTVADGGVGFTGATGDFVAKFNTNAATQISQITVNFTSSGNAYQLGIWDATGANGSPGTNIYTSGNLTSAIGVNVIPVSPAVSIPAGGFFVGVRQTGTINIGFAYQVETPIRGGSFYFTSPSGGTTWTDFAPNNSFRFMIEPKLILATDGGLSNPVLPQGDCGTAGNQTVSITLNNPGSNAISAGAASVALNVTGSNTFSGTFTNSTNIPSGGSEVINFIVPNAGNSGTENYSFDLTYAGDLDNSNNTVTTSRIVTATITNFPLDEGFESPTLTFGTITIVAGGRNLTVVQTGNYTNVDLGGNLAPHGGNKFILFDNFSGANSSGVVNRLSGPCIALPAATGGSCGYTLNFWMSHDASLPTFLDSLFVTISTNGGATWTRLTPGYGRYDATFVTPGWRKESISLAAYAGQVIKIGFEDVSKYGNVIGLDDVSIGSVGTQNSTLNTTGNNSVTLQQGCVDQGWTYYVDPAQPAQYLFAIQWDPNNTGANAAARAAATPRLQLDAADFAATQLAPPQATFTMKRYWNVDLNGVTMTAPVNMRFFYDSTEKAATTQAAIDFATANGGTVEPASWFKTVNTSVAGDAMHVNSVGVLDAIALTDVNAGAAVRFNGVLYAQFNGVSSFSGGTFASGVGTGTVLPIALLSFTGKKNGAVNDLNWTTASESNNKGFYVERSLDGNIYQSLGFVLTLSTNGNSSVNLYYTFTDKSVAGKNQYYRLRETNSDGSFKYSNVLLLKSDNATGIDNITIYPNPATTLVTIAVNTEKAQTMQFVIVDATGKTVMTKQSKTIAGINTIGFNVASLSQGIYLLKAVDEQGKIVTTKFIKE